MIKSNKSEQFRNLNAQVSDIDSFVGYWLRFVSNQVTTELQNKLKSKGVSVAEWIALRYLLSHPSCSLTQLAGAMEMNKGALSRLTDGLEKQGLIERKIDPQDRRLFSIELTPSGIKLVSVLAKIVEENDKQFFGHLKLSENKALIEALKTIVNRHDMRKKPLD
jgi:DNA-binding MarR family transcriptional regulator